MANYRAVVRHFPPALEYLRQAKWIRRGDVLAYRPGVSAAAFSTDEFGFRHTWFEDRNIGLGNLDRYEKVGLVLGSSHVFGFGLAHNRETLPSRLSEILGYPFFGISYPEADTRTLYASFSRLVESYGSKIARVVLVTGGDFTRFCYSEQADPLFGPPFLPQAAAVTPGGDADQHFANLVQFTSFWSSRFAAAAGDALCMLDDVTYFEKSEADSVETACGLGVPSDAGQRRRFAAHLRRALMFQAERRRMSTERGLLLAAFPSPRELLFIDEFHYRAATQDRIAQMLAAQIR